MKRMLLFLLAVCLLMTCTACSSQKNAKQKELYLVRDTPVTTEPVPDDTCSIAPVPDGAYSVYVHRGSFPVLADPGNVLTVVGTVGTAGTYTIVEEYRNEIGLRFGKLDSDMGWICLTKLQIEQENPASITAMETSQNGSSPNFYSFVAANDPYAVCIELVPNDTMTAVSVFSLDTATHLAEGPTLLQLDRWSSGDPLVLELTFWEYTGVYGIQFTNSSGIVERYSFQLHPSGETAWCLVEPLTQTYREPELAPWKKAYLTFLEDYSSYTEFALVYIDNDDIPELFIRGVCEADGEIVCAYKNGQVITKHLSRLHGGAYVERGGIFMNRNGNMGCYYSKVYKLTESGFVCTFTASQIESHVEETEDSEYIIHYEYAVGDTVVSEEEHDAALEAAFPFEKAEWYENVVDYDTVCQQISEH